MTMSKNCTLAPLEPFKIDDISRHNINRLLKDMTPQVDIDALIKSIESAVEFSFKVKDEQAVLLSKKEAKSKLKKLTSYLRKVQNILDSMGTGTTERQAKQILEVNPKVYIQKFKPDPVFNQMLIDNSDGKHTHCTLYQSISQFIQTFEKSLNDLNTLPNRPVDASKLNLASGLIDIYNEYTGKERWLEVESKCEELIYIVFNSCFDQEVKDISRTIQNCKKYLPIYRGTHMEIAHW
jgi:hypothetical protein